MELPKNPCEGCQHAPIYTNITVCKYCGNVDKRFSKMDLHKATLKAYKEFGEWVVEWFKEREAYCRKPRSGYVRDWINEADQYKAIREELAKALSELWKEDGHVTEG